MSHFFFAFLANLPFFFCSSKSKNTKYFGKLRMVESEGVNPQQRSSVNADFVTCFSQVSVFTFKLLFSFHE